MTYRQTRKLQAVELISPPQKSYYYCVLINKIVNRVYVYYFSYAFARSAVCGERRSHNTRRFANFVRRRVKPVRAYITMLLSRTDIIRRELNFRFFLRDLRTLLAVADMTVRVSFGKQTNILRNVQHTYTLVQTCCAVVPPIVRHETVIRRLTKPST